jgi:hypothetical protein
MPGVTHYLLSGEYIVSIHGNQNSTHSSHRPPQSNKWREKHYFKNLNDLAPL